MPVRGMLYSLLALLIFGSLLTVPSSGAVAPPIYGPFSPVFVGSEIGQFGFYGSVAPAGSFKANFEGVDAVQWGNAASHIANPNGAAGPKQYVQWTQGGFQAYDKKTGSPLLCPVNNSGDACANNTAKPVPWGWFWDGSTGSQVYECGHGSPTAGVLLYDQLDEVAGSVGGDTHGHWIMATHVSHGVHTYYCAAVSTGSDITNTTWNEYEYQLDGNGSGGQGGVLPYSSCSAGCITGLYNPDYLKLGTSVEVKTKTGSYLGGLYATWDLYSPSNSGFFVAGFETCTLNRNDLVHGRVATTMSCYYYLPSNNFPWTGTQSVQSVIHSLLPADFEGAASPPGTVKTEYFLATVNPYSGALSSNTPCVTGLCSSSQLALFTMGTDSTHPLTGPILLPVKSFTPACYDTVDVRNTYCVAQPTSGAVVDSIGDRLMHRLAYRFVKGATSSSEQLVAAQTIFNGTNQCTSHDSTPCTVIEWYKVIGPRQLAPRVVQGTIVDTAHPGNFLFMPSVGANISGNLQVTFEESGDTTHPSVYTVPITFGVAGGLNKPKEGTPLAVMTGKGDEQDSNIFGEFFSTSVDPCDDKTFWGTGEYFQTNETSTSGFNWQSRIYTTATSTPLTCSF